MYCVHATTYMVVPVVAALRQAPGALHFAFSPLGQPSGSLVGFVLFEYIGLPPTRGQPWKRA
eukprot:2221089-Prymnesium_polylepis.2